MRRLAVLLLILMLAGCAGKDPEKRDYAVGLFICGEGNVAVGTAKLSKSGDETTENIFYEGRGADLAEAVERTREKTGENLYFGHLALCVIDKRAISEKNLRELSSLFIDDEELGRNVRVMAADNAEELIDAAKSGFDAAAFAEKYCGKNGEYAKNKRSVDINALIYTLEQSGGGAQLPLVGCVNKVPEMKGGAVIENYIYKGDIPREEFLKGDNYEK